MKKPDYKKLSLVEAMLYFMVTLPVQAEIMIYPMKGQSSEQLSKDRYECHLWAVQQSGFDPSTAQAAQSTPQTQQQKGQVLRGGMRGAAAGAAIVATTGEIRGVFKRMDQSRATQSQANQPASGQDAYNRAIKACLTGRNYLVN